tara:strand:- start:321 stop:3059 length:2739 start_codon:yes stop_codon:yes gene_type:complete
MATKYILDPSGEVIIEKTDEGFDRGFGAKEFNEGVFSETKKTNSDLISNNANTGVTFISKNNPITQIEEISRESASQAIYATSDFNVELGFSPFNPNNQAGNESVIGSSPNSNSFGFVDDQTGSKDSFKSMYHFSDTTNNGEPRLFAKEFEMLTGYVFSDKDTFFGSDFVFLLEYFAEMIAILGTLEAITLLNELLNDNVSVDTRLVEKYNLRLGKYSIVEFDIFSKYVFDVLNYPKDHSNFLKRITAFFVGVSEWFSPDAAIDINKIVEETNRIQAGTRTKENFLDLLGIQNQFALAGGLVASLLNIAIAALDSLFTSLTSSSGQKRLFLLMKKFKQEAAWKSELFAKKKNEELEFFVSMDYYYTRFAIERMHIGLKLLNRYAYKKTYLNPAEPQSPLTRVSGNRMSVLEQDLFGFSESGEMNDRYMWSTSMSDKPGEFPGSKPGMTTRLRSLPNLLNLSYNFRLYLTESGENQIPASISQNFYVNKKEDRHKRRLPKEIVRKIEDYLESEYVPFYIHDVRTNEILSFHAFIESISDSFNPEYNSASGFGRIDDVKSYIKTTRNINLSFTIAATSEEDHDFMWYQINKLVTLVYPQWSEGYAANTNEGEQKFTYPFTQVPTASPLVRIRLGDVLKSNYSRSSLSRIFGVYESLDDNSDIHEEFDADDAVYQLNAGYYAIEPKSVDLFGISFIDGGKLEEKSYVKIDDPVKVKLVSSNDNLGSSIVVSIIQQDELEPSGDRGGAPKSLLDKNLLVSKSKLIKINSHSTNIKTLGATPEDRNSIMKPFKTVDGDENSLTSNNPITASYESGMSRGIAGFITQLDMNYGDSNWETTRIGSKAPMLVKVTINFAPIHDIVPGIDHNGMMRAPAYNVGRVNNAFFGDPHDGEVKNSGIQNALIKLRDLENSRYKKG